MRNMVRFTMTPGFKICPVFKGQPISCCHLPILHITLQEGQRRLKIFCLGWATCNDIWGLGNSLFFKNSFTTNWITFFENYLHMMLKTEIFFFICYKLAKLDQITFHYTEMAGKLLNLNLVSFKNYFLVIK